MIIDGKAISQVPEDLGTIFLELEMTRKVLSEIQVSKVRNQYGFTFI